MNVMVCYDDDNELMESINNRMMDRLSGKIGENTDFDSVKVAMVNDWLVMMR